MIALHQPCACSLARNPRCTFGMRLPGRHVLVEDLHSPGLRMHSSEGDMLLGAHFAARGVLLNAHWEESVCC